MVSISIDPEYDTPEVLRQYASRFNAGSAWTFLTGDRVWTSPAVVDGVVYFGSHDGHIYAISAEARTG